MSFEWRTDEEKGWQEKIKPNDTAVTPLWRRWPLLLVLLLCLAIVWGAVRWQINQRVMTVTEDISAEILNTHNFVLQTAVDRDENLFKANLSGRDPEWVAMQKTLLNDGLLLNRPMLGWQQEIASVDLTLDDVTLTLSPDFQAVELIYPQQYAVTLPNHVIKTVTLRQTAVYRQGDTRWLYAPPYREFWGAWVTQGGERLTLVYPKRDQAVAARLAVDLDVLVEEMCTGLTDLNCDTDLRVHLRLDSDPQSILAMNEIETTLNAGLRLALPTPTLVGLPTDEAGYEVLYRAYGVQVATAVLSHQIGHECCRHQLFFRALRDYQLAQLGLIAWPVEEAMFGQMLSAGFDGDVFRHWTRRWQESSLQIDVVDDLANADRIWWQVYMLIDYLNTGETAVSPTEMMRLLHGNTYHSWLENVLGNSYNQDDFPGLFLEYIYAQSWSGQQAEPPLPFPTGEIDLICIDHVYGLNSKVYAYDLNAGTWAEKFAHMELPTGGYISTLDGQHFIMSDSFDSSANKFYLVTEDNALLLEEVAFPDSAKQYVSYSFSNLPAQYIIRHEWGLSQDDEEFALRSLDCPTEGCPEILLAGTPLFSPNGQYFIERKWSVQGNGLQPNDILNEYSLVSLDGKIRWPIGSGLNSYSFWLDDETYGFVQAVGDGWELVAASVTQPEPYILLRQADMLAAIPSVDELSGPFTYQVFPVTYAGTTALIVQMIVDGAQGRQNYLFRVTLSADLGAVEQIELLWTGSSAAYGYSPDGRFLILNAYDYDYTSTNGESPYYLLDQETGQLSDVIISIDSNMSWSSDGQWFVQNAGGYLLLQAPHYNYQHYIPYHFGTLNGCRRVVLSVAE